MGTFGPSFGLQRNFWTLSYTTWELRILDSQLHHMGASETSIGLQRNFWTLNYTIWELLDPQLQHIGTSKPIIRPHMNF
jgi:hypothetical protein